MVVGGMAGGGMLLGVEMLGRGAERAYGMVYIYHLFCCPDPQKNRNGNCCEGLYERKLSEDVRREIELYRIILFS